MEMKPEYDDLAAQVVALLTLTDTPRHVPDVPQDAEFDDFMMEHFNDPNFDLHKRSKLNLASVESLPNKKDTAFKDGGSDFDTESHVESTGYSDAPMSDFTDFDEYVLPLELFAIITYISLVSRPTPRCARQSRALTTPPCPSAPSACGPWVSFTLSSSPH